jgi:3-dehydroquinate synthase
METVRVNLGPRAYDIRLASDSAGLIPFARTALPKASFAFVVTDENVEPHAAAIAGALQTAGLPSLVATIAPGESQKNLDTAALLYDQLAAKNADRKAVVVAVGGGVVGDLAGFVAATYNRGLRLFMVPTTLLSMVDSAVGGKTGVNLPAGKNLVGAFHQPSGVWINPAYLDTLPDREFRSGLAEVVKYGVILDAEFFAWQEANVGPILARDPAALQHVVGRSCRLKADVVEKDELELTGLRAVLNYGHTLGHAYEAVGGYGTWLHGEAIAAGMADESRLAERLGRISPDVTARQVRLLEAFGLPTAGKREWPAADLLAVMRRDKKASAGQLRFVLPTRIGHVAWVEDVPESLVMAVLTS